MKYNFFIYLLPFLFVGCSKNDLTINSELEKKLCESAYKSNINNKDGYKIKTFIDPNIQKIAKESLVKDLISNNAESGCIVIMETISGKIKAMVNLNKASTGGYLINNTIAVSKPNELGGLMKPFDLLALLEDKKADTSTVFNTHGGEIYYSGIRIRDINAINGEVSLAEAFNLSSNTVFAQAINNSYYSNPNLFCNRFKNLGIDKLNLPFEIKEISYLPKPEKKNWSKITLPWLSMGYGLTLTPIEILTFYNSIANNGVMVKPLFLSEIADENSNIKKYETVVINSKIASRNTISTLQNLLSKKQSRQEIQNPVFNNIKVAGVSAIIPLDYIKSDLKKRSYLASYVGFFPTNKPKYSFLCFIYNPKKEDPIYDSVICNEVIKSIKEKI